MQPTETAPSARLSMLLHAAFLVSGTATVLIGPLLPLHAKAFELNDLWAGSFFPAQFAGSLLGTAITSRLGRIGRYKLGVSAGCLALAAGIASMNAGVLTVVLGGFLLIGLGVGLTLPSINMLVLEMNTHRSGQALSFLNFCWGLGAIVCKPFVDLTARGTDLTVPTSILAVILIFAGVSVGLARYSEKRQTTADAGVQTARLWRRPIAWAIAVFNFLHVGFESAMGGWLPAYTERIGVYEAAIWLSPTLLYFLFFVMGRGVAPMLFRYFSDDRMLIGGLVAMLAGMAIILSAGSVEQLMAGAAVAGFGTSWIFPTNVARFYRACGPEASRNATPLFIMGTLGAAASTWFVGFVSNNRSSLRAGMGVLAAIVVALIAIQAALSIGGRRVENNEGPV